MFVIAQERDGRTYYWCGGDIWTLDAEEAAKFESYGFAFDTLVVIRNVSDAVIGTAAVIELP